MSEAIEAPCPFHAAEPTTGHCQRCGSFMCQQCEQLNPHFCPKCAERHASLPSSEDKLSLPKLLAATWHEVFKPQWRQLLMAAFIAGVLFIFGRWILQFPEAFAAKAISSALTTSVVLETRAETLVAASVASLLLGPLLLLPLGIFWRGFLEMATAAWNAQKLDFNALFNLKAGFKAACAYFLATLPNTLYSCVYSYAVLYLDTGMDDFPSPPPAPFAVLLSLLVIALVLWLLSLQLGLLPFAAKPEVGIGEGIRQCWEKGKGRRWQIFKVLLPCNIALGCVNFFSLKLQENSTAMDADILLERGILVCGVILLVSPVMAFFFTFLAGYWKTFSCQTELELR